MRSTAARALDLTLTSRSKDARRRRHSRCAASPITRPTATCPPRPEGLPRCDLRAGRGPAQGQGPRQARGGSRRLARHADRRHLSGSTRAGVPDVDCRAGAARPTRSPSEGERADRVSRRIRHRAEDGRPGGHLSQPADERSPSALTRGSDDVFGVALIDLSTGEFTAAEIRGRRPAGAERRNRGIAPARARAGRLGILDSLPEIAQLQVPVTTAEGWSFELEAARRTLLEQLKTQGLEGFGLDGRAVAMQAAGGLVTLSARHTEGRPRARPRREPQDRSRSASSIDPITLRHLEVLGGSEGGPQGSLLHEIDRTVTSMGGRLLRAWLRPPARIAGAHPRPARRRRGAGVPIDRAREVPRGRSKSVHDLERLVARAALGTAGPRDLVSLRQSLAAIPRSRSRCSRTCRRRCSEACMRSSTIWPTCATSSSGRSMDEPPALRARGRLHARRRRRRARRAQDHQPLRPAGHRRDGGAGARPHRDRVAQGPLQSRLRLLHRDLEVEPARRARPTISASRRLPAASGSRRRH